MTRMTALDCAVVCNLINTHTQGTGMGKKIGSGRAEEGRRSARNRTVVVDAMWEKGETWAETGKNVENKGLVQQLPTQAI